MPFTRNWTAQEDSYLIQNYTRLPYVALGKHLDRSPKAVADRRTVLQLPAKLPRLPVNSHYFDAVDSHEKAYLLGFIAADGWVGTHSGNHHMLTLRLQLRDIAVVEMLRDAIAPQKDINTDSRAVRIDVSLDDHLYSVLSDRHGIIVGRKASFSKPPVDPGVSASFWLGYFDGDGSMIRTKRGHLIWSLCGSLKLMTEFLAEVEDMLISSPTPRPHCKTKWLHYVQITTLEDIRTIDEWIHQSGLGLDRKRMPDCAYTHLIASPPRTHC